MPLLGEIVSLAQFETVVFHISIVFLILRCEISIAFFVGEATALCLILFCERPWLVLSLLAEFEFKNTSLELVYFRL